jgi:hypothetical protein
MTCTIDDTCNLGVCTVQEQGRLIRCGVVRGCSLAQLCARFDAAIRDGKRDCSKADWRNDVDSF